MPESKLKIVSKCVEHRPRAEIPSIPRGIRGIYVLLEEIPKRRTRENMYDVAYIGMSNSSVRARLKIHAKSGGKKKRWTHFSIYQVFDNIRKEEIGELEGILRAIYRKDSRANRLNLQKRHVRLLRVRTKNVKKLKLA